MGVKSIPGYNVGTGSSINTASVYTRTVRAIVRSTDSTNGFVKVDYDGLVSGGKDITVNPLWMSFPFPDPEKGQYPAWGRFMPQPGDIMKVSFDPSNNPTIVGYDISAGKPNIANGAGWPQINSVHESAKADPSKKLDVNINGKDLKVSIAKYALFTPLHPGEYDFMSSGGAYIYGQKDGKLLLAGGTTTISIAKAEMRISQMSQLLTHQADDCEFRFGQVRRPDDNGVDATVEGKEDNKEFRVNIKITAAAGQSTDLIDFHMGNVVDVDGNVVNTPYSAKDARYLLKVLDGSGEEVYQSSIDKEGNWDVKATDSKFTAKFKNTDLISDKISMGSEDGNKDWVALAKKVKDELKALRTSLNNLISTYNNHMHMVSGVATAGGPTAQAQTSPVPTQTPLSTATDANEINEVKSDTVEIRG
jgi:hypothetical protein